MTPFARRRPADEDALAAAPSVFLGLSAGAPARAFGASGGRRALAATLACVLAVAVPVGWAGAGDRAKAVPTKEIALAVEEERDD